MAACTPATNAVDRLLRLLDQLSQVIDEVREQAQQVKEGDDDERPDC